MTPKNQSFDWLNEEDDDKAASTAFAAAKWISDEQTSRAEELALQARMYGGVPKESFSGYVSRGSWVMGTPSPRASAPNLSHNVIRSVVDTAVARVSGMDVRPLFLSRGGDWSYQQRCKRLEQYVDGQLRSHKVRQLGPEVFRDACVYDIGAVHVFQRDGQTAMERVWPLELLVDYTEGRYRTPRTLYRKKWVPKDTLRARFPKCEDIIKSASPGDWLDSETQDSMKIADMALVVEGWWLPAKKGAKGRHVLALSSGALLVEDWTKTRFPFAFLRYSTRLLGMYGQGMAEHLKGNQRQINTTLRAIQEMIQKGAVPQVWLQTGNAGVAKTQFTNEIMAVRTYTGDKPVFSPGIDPPPSLFDFVDRLWAKSFEQEGVSQLDATSQKPAGLDSEPSIRAYRDVGATRFITATKNYEAFILDLAELLVDVGRDIAKDDPSFEILVPGKRYNETLRFKDVDLERDKYVIELYPTAMLPIEPAGRLAQVTDMLKAGMIDSVQGKRLLQFPDIDEVVSLETAPVEDILAEISHLLQGGKYRPPEPFQDFALGIKYFQFAWAKARRDGAPADLLDNLQLWVVQAGDQLKLGSPAPPSPGAAPGVVPPPANPTATPTSSLVPNMPPVAAAV